MQKVKVIFKKYYKNKFLIAAVLFLLWLGLFDQNNLLVHRKLKNEIKQLENDIDFYQQQIANEKRKLEELQTDKNNLEKFAREEYLMKKENEDIFLIVEED